MGYSNPPIPWSEFERRLSDSRRPGGPPIAADGGDSPAWSLKRHPYRADPPPPLPELILSSTTTEASLTEASPAGV